MIVQVTESKYNVGSSRGYGIEVPDLEFKLNAILDTTRSTWPDPKDNRTQEEIDSGIPAPPPLPRELHEGDVFLFDGTVFAIDHDRLVQVVSETGPLAFQRVFDNLISPEIEFSYFEDDENDYSWDDELLELPEGLEEYIPKYEWMVIWHQNFWEGRNLRKEPVIRVGVTNNLFGITRYIYLTEWKLWYSKDDFDDIEIPYFLRQIMCWFYSEIGRI